MYAWGAPLQAMELFPFLVTMRFDIRYLYHGGRQSFAWCDEKLQSAALAWNFELRTRLLPHGVRAMCKVCDQRRRSSLHWFVNCRTEPHANLFEAHATCTGSMELVQVSWVPRLVAPSPKLPLVRVGTAAAGGRHVAVSVAG